MKTDRFLTGIVIGIGVLIVVALVLFFTRRTTMVYVPDDRPENIVQNFALAVHTKDFQKAYDYMADLDHKPSFDAFRQFYLSQEIELNKYSLQVGTSAVTNDRAVVYCSLVYAGGGPFGSINRQQGTASLFLKGPKWKVTEMPFVYWDYSWYNPNVVPAEKFQPNVQGD